MLLNPAFISNVHTVYGKSGIAWINGLPSQLKRLATKWNIRFIKPMPNLSYNFVGIVERLEYGDSAIIKISADTKQIDNEMRWLRSFTHAVPQLYYYDPDECALLMECIKPGHALTTVVNSSDDGATRIICRVIQQLQSHQHKSADFKHLSELVIHLEQLNGQIDQKLLSKAKALFRDLTQDRNNDVLLHGDLHHYNILASGTGWKVIDPHGYIGDPAFEVGAMIYNPCHSFPKNDTIDEIIERRLKILAEELPFDAKKINAWAFCMTMLSMAWNFEDHATISALEISIAHSIDKLQC